ncbi:hypothetical protein CHS0354_033940 [Potamilus streckersoni]|uniref:Uncharacterized protein n=1 Tax=Potamilus streckersoni TaxID=2493646 RepID=A0AAE0W9T9_9BIVA|nr:hypothetical protein CHS0354_033940 [Potamilus streckersoni]
MCVQVGAGSASILLRALFRYSTVLLDERLFKHLHAQKMFAAESETSKCCNDLDHGLPAVVATLKGEIWT